MHVNSKREHENRSHIPHVKDKLRVYGSEPIFYYSILPLDFQGVY